MSKTVGAMHRYTLKFKVNDAECAYRNHQRRIIAPHMFYMVLIRAATHFVTFNTMSESWDSMPWWKQGLWIVHLSGSLVFSLLFRNISNISRREVQDDSTSIVGTATNIRHGYDTPKADRVTWMYEAGMTADIVTDGIIEAFFLGLSGEAIPVAVMVLNCCTALTRIPWTHQSTLGMVAVATYMMGATKYGTIQPTYLATSMLTMPFFWVINYYSDLAHRVDFMAERRITMFRQAYLRHIPKFRATMQAQFAEVKKSNKLAEFISSSNGRKDMHSGAPTIQKILATLDDLQLVNDMRTTIKEAEATNKAILNAEKAQSLFLATMSHELRTPLTSIIGAADMLKMTTSLEKNEQSLLQLILSSSDHLLSVVNDILDFSKLTAPDSVVCLEMCSFDPLYMLETVMMMFVPQAKTKHIRLRCRNSIIPRTLRLVADATRIKQIVVNLVSNALKFTPADGAVNVTAACIPHPSPPEGPERVTFRIRVEDTGIGMKPETVEKLFKPFTQGENGTTRRFGGTGLGLCISHQLVERMKGNISIKSDYGKGSTFTLEIPVDVEETDENVYSAGRQIQTLVAPKQPSPSIIANSLKGSRVLVVDDLPKMRNIISTMLVAASAEVTTCNDGTDAVIQVTKSLRNDKGFDVIVMDYHMPQMTGVQATNMIREQHGDQAPSVVGLTADISGSVRSQFYLSGATDVVFKPVRFKKLVTALRAVLDNHAAQCDG